MHFIYSNVRQTHCNHLVNEPLIASIELLNWLDMRIILPDMKTHLFPSFIAALFSATSLLNAGTSGFSREGSHASPNFSPVVKIHTH